MPRPTALTAAIAGAASDPPFLFRALRNPVRAVLRRWFALTVEGLNHLPTNGPYIVAANHHNYLDGVVLGVAVPVPIGFLVMPRVYRATPLHPFLHDHLGSIPVDLARPDVAALRRALQALKTGRVLGVFPEGPFSVRGRLELVYETTMTPQTIAAAVDRALTGPPPSAAKLDTSGADTSARLLTEWVRARNTPSLA